MEIVRCDSNLISASLRQNVLTSPSNKTCPLFDELEKGIFYTPPSFRAFFWKVSLMSSFPVIPCHHRNIATISHFSLVV